MKKTKRWLAVLLALCMAFGLLPATAFADDTSDPSETTVFENGVVKGFIATEGTVPDGSNYNERYDKLVDGTTGTKWCIVGIGGGIYTQFESTVAFVPTGYRLTTGNDTGELENENRNPKSWKVLAKVNSSDENWDELSVVTNDEILQKESLASFTFGLDQISGTNTKAYKYFRFEVSAVQSGSTFQLSEFEFIGHRVEASDTSYTTQFNEGVVTGFIVTAGTRLGNYIDGNTGHNYNVSTGSGEGQDKLVDGIKTNKFCLTESGGRIIETIYVEFESSVAFVPTGYIMTTGGDTAWNNNSGRNPKNWEIKAKASKSGDWVTLAYVIDNYTMGGFNNKPYEFDFNVVPNNTTKYKYFRFEVSDVQSGGIFQLAEFEFKGYKDTNDLSGATVSGVNASYEYSGQPIPITPAVTDLSGNAMTFITDYTVTLDGEAVTEYPISVEGLGLHTLVFTGVNNYKGSKTVSFGVAPAGLSADLDYSADEAGFYYINMPQNGASSESAPKAFTVPEGFDTPFKVYSDGGKNGVYDGNNYDGWLLLTAPAGCGLKLSGAVLLRYDIAHGTDLFVNFYDGDSVDSPLLAHYTSKQNSINELYSTGRSVLIYFFAHDLNWEAKGLDLTVDIITPYDLDHGSVSGIDAYYPLCDLSQVPGSFTVKDRFGAAVDPQYYSVTYQLDEQTAADPLNINTPGTYTMTATGISPYTGTITRSFVVYGEELDSPTGEWAIGSDADWLTFVYRVNSGMDWDNFYILTADIRALAPVGTEEHPFFGSIYGDGHTITVDFPAEDGVNAPFAYVGGYSTADIYYITVTGTIDQPIENDGGCEAGLIGKVMSGAAVDIVGCSVSASVCSANDHCGGFIGLLGENSECSFDSCVFDGKLIRSGDGAEEWGGFVGKKASSATLTFEDCLYAPAALGEGESEPNASYTFVNAYGEYAESNFESCYYTRTVNSNSSGAQGRRAATSAPSNELYTTASISSTEIYPVSEIAVDDWWEHTGNDLHDDIVSAVSVTYGGAALTKDTDYLVSLQNDVTMLGQYELTVSGVNSSGWFGSKTITIHVVRPLSGGTGTESDPFKIDSVEAWNNFAANVTDGCGYGEKYVALAEDITVTNMVGSAADNNIIPFRGTFTGLYNGTVHTLTLNYDVTENFAAPFLTINGAAIIHLKVNGTITTTGQFAAGIASRVFGTCLIEDCLSSVTINSSVSGDGTHGGFAGVVNGSAKLTIRGCVFNGSMNGGTTSNCGGFVGWNSNPDNNNCSTVIYDSLFDPAEITVSSNSSAAFMRNPASNSFGSEHHCFRMASFGQDQGMSAHTLTVQEGVDGVSFAHGDGTAYAASGLTVYSGYGFTYGNNFYAGAGQEVTLTVDVPSGYAVTAVTYNDGTTESPAASTDSGYKFTMPDSNTTVSAAFTNDPAEMTFSGVEIRAKTEQDGKTDLRFIFRIALNSTKLEVGSEWYGPSTAQYELAGINVRYKKGSGGEWSSSTIPIRNLFTVSQTDLTFTVVFVNLTDAGLKCYLAAKYAYGLVGETAEYHQGVAVGACIDDIGNGNAIEHPEFPSEP